MIEIISTFRLNICHRARAICDLFLYRRYFFSVRHVTVRSHRARFSLTGRRLLIASDPGGLRNSIRVALADIRSRETKVTASRFVVLMRFDIMRDNNSEVTADVDELRVHVFPQWIEHDPGRRLDVNR